MLVEVPGLVAWMIVMLARLFLAAGRVAVAMLVKVPGLMARMIVMLARHFLPAGRVAMAVLVEVAGLMAGMVMMRAGLFLWHIVLREIRITIDAPVNNSADMRRAALKQREEILCRERNCFDIVLQFSLPRLPVCWSRGKPGSTFSAEITSWNGAAAVARRHS